MFDKKIYVYGNGNVIGEGSIATTPSSFGLMDAYLAALLAILTVAGIVLLYYWVARKWREAAEIEGPPPPIQGPGPIPRPAPSREEDFRRVIFLPAPRSRRNRVQATVQIEVKVKVQSHIKFFTKLKMPPKQKIVKPTPAMKSAPMKRLLKWIQRKYVENGCVTYYEVKQFLEFNEKYAYKVQEIMEMLLKNGHLEKIGFRYVVPTPSRSKKLKSVRQVASTDRGKQKTTKAKKSTSASAMSSGKQKTTKAKKSTSASAISSVKL